MWHISSRIVGDNLKGETALLSFAIPSGGEEIIGTPLYTFHSWWIKLCSSWMGMKGKKVKW